MATTANIVNLDCMEPTDLWKYANNKKKPRSLRDYAHFKAGAMRYRESGYIAKAISFEEICDKIYQSLPADQRW